MARKKIVVVGYFAYERGAKGDNRMFGGQTAKCRSLASYLKGRYPADVLLIVDTYRWKSRPLSLLIESLRALKGSDIVLMALSENGLSFFMPMLLALRRVWNYRLGYVVIGGWITTRCKNSGKFLGRLKRLDSVFAETIPMTEELQELGVERVEYAPNAKDLEIADKADTADLLSAPYSVGTFSRVSREKGISDAIEAVAWVNSVKPGLCHLKVYGPVAPDYKDEFERLVGIHADCVEYCGSIPSNESAKAVGSLLLLLFPTRWYGEGFPGTILDAYASGVPVLASDWKNARSIIREGETGFVCEFGSIESFKEKLLACLDNPQRLLAMRSNCLVEAEKYLPLNAFTPMDGFISQTQ